MVPEEGTVMNIKFALKMEPALNVCVEKTRLDKCVFTKVSPKIKELTELDIRLL